jgi:hypothetical protein
MLEGLERIDWAGLGHAYGSAEDVPELLRALASPEKDAREEAISALYGNIWHQGTVYGATSRAVPFLIELAAHPALPDRELILELLYDVAQGTSFLDVHQHLPVLGKGLREDPEFENNKEEELRWVRAAVDAVRDGCSAYLALLDDGKPPVRRGAARMLTCCRRLGGEVAASLMEHYRGEVDPATRATLLYAMGSLGVDEAASLATKALEDATPIVRLAAALTICAFSLAPVDDRIVQLLLDMLQQELDYESFPFGEDQQADIAASLTAVAPEHRPRVAAAVLEVVERGAGGPLEVAEPLLALTFDGPLQGTSLAPLSELQRRALVWVARHTWQKKRGIWSTFGNLASLLRAYGLEELGQRLVGHESRRD